MIFQNSEIFFLSDWKSFIIKNQTVSHRGSLTYILSPNNWKNVASHPLFMSFRWKVFARVAPKNSKLFKSSSNDRANLANYSLHSAGKILRSDSHVDFTLKKLGATLACTFHLKLFNIWLGAMQNCRVFEFILLTIFLLIFFSQSKKSKFYMPNINLSKVYFISCSGINFNELQYI